MESAYNQILERFSVRRYQPRMLESSVLEGIDGYVSAAQGLDDSNSFSCNVHIYDIRDQTSGALGVYGKIFQAPYFLAPVIQGEIRSLVDLGFRTQQIVLDLWKVGIGSCYIGCVHQQNRVSDLLDLNKNERVISMVAFGIPAENQSKYLYQKVLRTFARSKKRLNYEELFLEGSLPHYADLSDESRDIIEAGRQAPSATNSQPWRFGITQGYFEIYAVRKLIGRFYDLDQEYTLHDVGICMANMSRAANALRKEIQWELFPVVGQDRRDKILPIARFRING